MDNIAAIFGREFASKLANQEYGVFRKNSGRLPEGFTTEKFGTPFAGDSSGNLFTEAKDGNICFWDHETDNLTVISPSWNDFSKACVEPARVTLKEGQVKSVWVNPEFAAKLGIKAPKDGWKKQKTD